MAPTPDKTRRPGYAPPANVGVGRRGLHTRERILARAAEVFLANGFHSTSLDTIAKAANASRATVYQYFAGKEEIFRELSAAAERDVLRHGDRMGVLGPTADGVSALHRWLTEWADVYDAHAAAFAEYPGIGTELTIVDVGPIAETYAQKITGRLRGADLSGLSLEDAAAVLMRIPHMVHLYRYRAMLPLPPGEVTTRSLTIALQLMLFPHTPAAVLPSAEPFHTVATTSPPPVVEPAPATEGPPNPTAHDVLAVSSTLFADRGYYAVGMEEIAAAADVSRATLYRHFSTKADILAELTRRAVTEIEGHALALPRMAEDSLTEWMVGYVRFHRTYGGVIRAWFDGTVAEHLSDATVEHGIGAIYRAIDALLATAELTDGLHRVVASAVFLAVLGRMTEPTVGAEPSGDEHVAQLMVSLLRRSLLRD